MQVWFSYKMIKWTQKFGRKLLDQRGKKLFGKVKGEKNFEIRPLPKVPGLNQQASQARWSSRIGRVCRAGAPQQEVAFTAGNFPFLLSQRRLLLLSLGQGTKIALGQATPSVG